MNKRSTSLVVFKSTKSSRKRRHRQADWEALLGAAERVFQSHGYHAGSMRHIAREAGLSVGGVYQFVRNKNALYLQVLEEHWRRFFETVDTALASQIDTQARLAAFTTAVIGYVSGCRGFFRIYLADRVRFSGTMRDRVTTRARRSHRQLHDRITHLMREGIEEGLLGWSDADFLASAYLGLLQSTIIDLVIDSAPAPAPRAEALVSLFIRGAASSGSPICVTVGQ
jgi:AcrR family transcriptional regulator